jgi:hypothetical protein
LWGHFPSISIDIAIYYGPSIISIYIIHSPTSKTHYSFFLAVKTYSWPSPWWCKSITRGKKNPIIQPLINRLPLFVRWRHKEAFKNSLLQKLGLHSFPCRVHLNLNLQNKYLPFTSSTKMHMPIKKKEGWNCAGFNLTHLNLSCDPQHSFNLVCFQ